MPHAAALLVGAVFAVGVLHTLVPDHWVPIILIARQRGWSTAETARAAAGAGLGHAVSTLVIAMVVWAAGVAFATRFGHAVDLITSLALVAFGGWVAVGAFRELRAGGGHAHVHRHDTGEVHIHWHTHDRGEWHAAQADSPEELLHVHEHATSGRTALLLVLGSSPMVEGIPAFFAASRYGIGLIALMSVVFTASTIATYVALCVTSARGLQRIDLGPVERYGEVLSGLVIAALGIAFLFFR